MLNYILHQINQTTNRNIRSLISALSIFFTLTYSHYSSAQVNAPSLRCISVNTSGSVDLRWIPSVDSLGGFSQYEIFRGSSLSGPFSLIGSINNIATNTFNDGSINAQTAGPFYYCVRALYNFAVPVIYKPIDTLSNIKMVVNNPGTNGLQLSWNTLSTPPPSTGMGMYRVYREFPANSGNWILVATTTATNYFDQVNYCNRLVNYRIETDDQSGCTSVSSIDGEIYQDQISPNIPLLDSVSVNISTGAATLGWSNSSSMDVAGNNAGYIIYYYNGSALVTLDTVSNSSTYTDLNTSHPQPSDGSQFYCIAAMDSCKNVSLITSFQKTIFLTQELDKCNNKNVLKWSKYINWPGGVGTYEVYMKEDGGAYALLGSVSGNDTSFTHTGLIKGRTYCYYVRAINASNNNKTSTSNECCVYAAVPTQPTFLYLSHVSVTAKNKIEVKAYTDILADVLKYKVSRASDIDSEYKEIDDIPFSSSSPFVIYTDTDVQTDSIKYSYKLTSIDSCENESIVSNSSKSMVLRTSSYINLINSLDWSPYEGFDAGVRKYDIYRSVEGTSGAELIGSVGSNVLHYEDNVNQFLDKKGTFCYYIVAREANGNRFSIADSSFSNTSCTFQEPTLYVPNAFNPDGGINLTFKPVCVFVDEKDYRFEIYDRGGRIIFSTNKTTDAWDGNGFGGGVYVYRVSYIDLNGIPFEKRGTVTLIR